MEEEGGPKKRRRKKAILWYNPPFSANIKTNIGKAFFAILDKHFPKGSELAKIFNRSTVKLSYSCMPAMKEVINVHNKKILTDTGRVEKNGCNCRGGVKNCPLEGECLTPALVYRAEVNSVEGQMEYLGQTACTFKTRFTNHKASFQHQKKELSTTLSKYVWELKKRQIDYNIKWSAAAIARPYRRGTRTCQLCSTEKLLIANQDVKTGLNRRGEVMSRCRHVDKHLLNNWTSHHHQHLAVVGDIGQEGEQPPSHHQEVVADGHSEGDADSDKGGEGIQDQVTEGGGELLQQDDPVEGQDGHSKGGEGYDREGVQDQVTEGGGELLKQDDPGGGGGCGPKTRSQTRREKN